MSLTILERLPKSRADARAGPTSPSCVAFGPTTTASRADAG